MGNSEVGHLNIGAGRIVHMDITRIDQAIADGSFFQNDLLLQAMQRGQKQQLHLLGLLSDGGVHSHMQHLFALLRMAKQNKVERVFVHCFMDGRDTPPHSGMDYLRQLQQQMREIGAGRIASLSGRYYAMDRDNRWERVERAYRAVVHGQSEMRAHDPVEAMRKSYESGVTDEFAVPVAMTDGPGPAAAPVARIRDDDAVIFFNFRADRARQMTKAVAEPGFDKFADPARPKNLCFVAMTQYDKSYAWLKYVLSPEKLEHILAQVFAEPQPAQPARGRNGKVRARHLFFQRRRGKAISRRRAPAGALAEGADLRPDAGDVRRGHCRRRDSRHRKGRFRRHRHELRQRRHGRPLRQAGSHDPRRRNRGRLPGPHLSVAEAARRRLDHHRRSRQRGNHDRPGHRRPAHLSHHQSRPVHPAA